MTELLIQSRTHPYAVREIGNLSEALGSICREKRVFLLVDSNVAAAYGREINSKIPGDRICSLEASETMKSYASLETVFCQMLDAGFRRSDHLIVMGGGVLQDIGCFVASILFRGISWTLFPTTLLAQCDSCVGSKSSLNVGRFKNQLGTFYPPNEILLYFPFLDTLSEREIWSGLGEAIKLHLIKGPSEWNAFWPKLKTGRPSREILRQTVWDCLGIKQPFVEQDELDRGIRNILNYGHTFAHAFESATRYAIPHGIAVTMGILAATRFSHRLGWVDESHERLLGSVLFPCTLGFLGELKPSHLQTVLEAMMQDKKNSLNGITFILTRGPGMMQKHQIERSQVSLWLEEFISNPDSGPA